MRKWHDVLQSYKTEYFCIYIYNIYVYNYIICNYVYTLHYITLVFDYNIDDRFTNAADSYRNCMIWAQGLLDVLGHHVIINNMKLTNG